jgi:hypothetical protein
VPSRELQLGPDLLPPHWRREEGRPAECSMDRKPRSQRLIVVGRRLRPSIGPLDAPRHLDPDHHLDVGLDDIKDPQPGQSDSTSARTALSSLVRDTSSSQP